MHDYTFSCGLQQAMAGMAHAHLFFDVVVACFDSKLQTGESTKLTTSQSVEGGKRRKFVCLR